MSTPLVYPSDVAFTDAALREQQAIHYARHIPLNIDADDVRMAI